MAGSPPSVLPSSSTAGSDTAEAGSLYWWKTTGCDLARMLHAANYPEEVQRTFLSYYKDDFIPLLGNAPGPEDERSWTWDGSTHEYSFELKGSTKALDVRFVADFSHLDRWTGQPRSDLPPQKPQYLRSHLAARISTTHGTGPLRITWIAHTFRSRRSEL